MIVRDFDADNLDDDPEWGDAPDDDETMPCPHCGEPVYDDAERCPSLRPIPVSRGCSPPSSVVGLARRGALPVRHLEVNLLSAPLRVAWVYDMNACRNPTGVTRHALGQLDRLADRPDIALTAVTGRTSDPDGRACWERLEKLRRRELPLSTRDALRVWRTAGAPALEWWTGPLDWVYCPAEMVVPTRKARLAATSHDVLQDVRMGSPRRRALLAKVFDRANLILSVSHFNSGKLLELYPQCRGKVAHVPNAAEEIFFGEATPRERSAVRADLGLPPGLPYLISVASFQSRKNLVRLVRAAGRLPEVANGRFGAGPAGGRGGIRGPTDPRGHRKRRPQGDHQDARLSPGTPIAVGLCRGHRPGVPLDLRKLRHPRRGGDGPENPGRPGRLHRPARDRRRGRLVLSPDRRGRPHRHPSRPPRPPRRTGPPRRDRPEPGREVSLASGE